MDLTRTPGGSSRVHQIISVTKQEDILPEYRGTPVELLLEYHNLGRATTATPAPQLLIGMCMDSRKALRIPSSVQRRREKQMAARLGASL